MAALSFAPAAARPRIDPNDLDRTATLTFADEFDELNLRDTGVGTWDTTFPWSEGGNGGTLASNGEKQWYIDARFRPTASVRPWTVDDGKLAITARRAAPAIQRLINGYRYTSGLLTTHSSFRQTYGYFEMRAKFPAGRGLWPAFWLLQPDGRWPPEIDVVELLGHDPSTIHTGVHYTDGGRTTKDGRASPVANTSADWHTYGVDWQPDQITWYFDNKPVHRTSTPIQLHGPMYILINLAVGGTWPGDPDSTTQFPSSLMVDYVRVYASKQAPSK
jgi:beta-glucanase (GH16 family)